MACVTPYTTRLVPTAARTSFRGKDGQSPNNQGLGFFTLGDLGSPGLTTSAKAGRAAIGLLGTVTFAKCFILQSPFAPVKRCYRTNLPYPAASINTSFGRMQIIHGIPVSPVRKTGTRKTGSDYILTKGFVPFRTTLFCKSWGVVRAGLLHKAVRRQGDCRRCLPRGDKTTLPRIWMSLS